jgi:hypothetical protein
MVYGTGTYGFYGYAYANLGEKYQFVHTYVSPLTFPRPSLGPAIRTGLR